MSSFNPSTPIKSGSTIAIATTTSYPRWYQGKLRSIKHTDKVRGDLALQFIETAVKKNYHIIVADWQSSRSFKKALSMKKDAVIIKRRSAKRSPSKRQTIKKASRIPGVSVIITTEPEKVALIEHCLSLMVAPLLTQKTDIVVPKRNNELFKKNYPTYQYESEVEGNRIYNEELRSHNLLSAKDEDFDMFFGPRAFLNTKKMLSLFMKKYTLTIGKINIPFDFFDAEEYSNVLFFPVIMALKKKIRVKSVEVPFVYPYIQRQNEEKGPREFFMVKRKAQRLALLIELLHFVSFLEKNPGSRVKS